MTTTTQTHTAIRLPTSCRPSHLALYLLVIAAQLSALLARSSDITANVFGSAADSTAGIMAAFGDFNSDELTDVFTLRNDKRTLEILLGNDVEPLMRAGPRCDFRTLTITSVVPGDFDGDAFMDVLMTARRSGEPADAPLSVYISWGGMDPNADRLNCSDESAEPVLRMRGEPVALDYNFDMIIDLFGQNEAGERAFWVFGSDRAARPREIRMHMPEGVEAAELAVPHSHAYLDLNGDFLADLFVMTKTHFEVWYGEKLHHKEDGHHHHEHEEQHRTDGDGAANAAALIDADEAKTRFPFRYSHKIELPTGTMERHVGQSIFLDVELSGQLNQVLPICFDPECHNSTLLVHSGNRFHDLQVNFKDGSGNVQWGFVPPRAAHDFLSAITLRGGDFNMDGYPDLLVTLARTPTTGGGLFGKLWPTGGRMATAQTQTFLLENVPCLGNCASMSRTFQVKWRDLQPFTNSTVAGAFYDFYQDGILDVLFVEQTVPQSSRMVAFSNKLDYDANFIKCIVLTGLTNRREPTRLTPLGRKKRTYGTNLPGPRIEYLTTTQDGEPQRGTSAQLPQSGYFSLQLPYTIFGLGRTPNFVDKLVVGLGNESRTWFQLIPNSQMIVVPAPLDRPSHWKAQLFVTPSKLIVKSVIALGATCVLIMLIILGLYIKEKRQDQVERLLEAHRFPFDAM